MANACRDVELLLPSEFLCDDFFYEVGAKACFPCELDSPVESVAADTESDEEEDHMAGLTQQMARYFLHDDDDKDASVAAPALAKAMALSPQSTLCPWSSASSKGSPNAPSLVSSPLSLCQLQQRNGGDDPRNLLYEAAGHVMRLRRLGDLGRRQSLYDRGILGPPKQSSPAVTPASKCTNAGCYAPSPAVLAHHELQAAHFYHLRRQQDMKQQLSAAAWGRQSKARGGCGGYNEGCCGRPMDPSPYAWPPLRKLQQQQPIKLPDSGMRAVFLSSPGARKESAGTGVFLPRTAGNKLEPRKKSGCSNVLVPDRVVQALNLSLEELAAQPRFPGGYVLSHDALIGRSSWVPSRQKKKHHLSFHQTTAAAARAAIRELGLPQEWTY